MTHTDVGGHDWLIPRGPGAFAHARDLARTALTAWGWERERVDVVVLLVSELVTNAHRHAGTQARLELRPLPEGVRLTVHDGDPTLPARRTPDLTTGTGGFGLHFLDRLVADWGIEPEANGKYVWADIRRTAP